MTTGSGTTVLAGIGSSVLDDLILPLLVVDTAKIRFNDISDMTFKKLATGGMDLLYAVEGYTHAIVVECKYIDGAVPGEVMMTRIGSSDCDGTEAVLGDEKKGAIETVLAFGKKCGCRMPEDVIHLVITGNKNLCFGEAITESMEPVLVKVMNVIERQLEEWLCCNV